MPENKFGKHPDLLPLSTATIQQGDTPLRRASASRKTLIVSAAFTLLAPSVILLTTYIIFKNAILTSDANSAVKMTTHFASIIDTNDLLSDSPMPDNPGIRRFIDFARNVELYKIKVFSTNGVTIFSSDSSDIGSANTRDYFRNIVMRGNIFQKYITKYDNTENGETIKRDVIETYVPIMQGDKFIGALEIYNDISLLSSFMRKTLWSVTATAVGLGLAMLAMVVFVDRRAVRAENALLVEGLKADRNRALTDLQHSESRYHAVFEQAATGIAKLTPDGTIIESNRMFREICRMAPDFPEASLPRGIIHPSHAALYDTCAANALAGEASGCADDFRCRLPDGSLAWLRISLSPLLGENGPPESLIAVCADITSQKLMEEALTFLALYDGETSADFFKSLCCFLRGATGMEAARVDLFPLEGETGSAASCSPDDSPPLPGRLIRDAAKETVYAVSSGLSAQYPDCPVLEGKDAGSFISASIPGAGGKPAGLISLLGLTPLPNCQALTAMLKTAAVRAASELERQKANEALVRATQAAEAANRSKSGFLATISHEIRTPLTGIAGLLQLLDNTQLNAEQARYVQLAMQSGRLLSSILNDILDMSKIEAGVLDLEIAPFAPERLLREVAAAFAHQADQAGLALKSSISPSVPESVSGDSSRIRQILFNLMSNAVKYTPAGVITLSAGTDQASGLLVFSVEDTGIGIPTDKLESVFDPYVRLGGSYAKDRSGAGLGLTISRQLAVLMGGMLTSESVSGRGSTFRLSVPLIPTDTAVTLTAAWTAHSNRGKSILLVEDDGVHQLTTTRLLQQHGYTVLSAPSGNVALEVLASEDVNAVLMDIRMSGLDGVETTKAMRDEKRFGEKSRVPIIAMTAHAMTADKAEFLAAGMSEHISKPIDIQKLLDVLSKHSG